MLKRLNGFMAILLVILLSTAVLSGVTVNGYAQPGDIVATAIPGDNIGTNIPAGMQWAPNGYGMDSSQGHYITFSMTVPDDGIYNVVLEAGFIDGVIQPTVDYVQLESTATLSTGGYATSPGHIVGTAAMKSGIHIITIKPTGGHGQLSGISLVKVSSAVIAQKLVSECEPFVSVVAEGNKYGDGSQSVGYYTGGGESYTFVLYAPVAGNYTLTFSGANWQVVDNLVISLDGAQIFNGAYSQNTGVEIQQPKLKTINTSYLEKGGHIVKIEHKTGGVLNTVRVALYKGIEQPIPQETINVCDNSRTNVPAGSQAGPQKGYFMDNEKFVEFKYTPKYVGTYDLVMNAGANGANFNTYVDGVAIGGVQTLDTDNWMLGGYKSIASVPMNQIREYTIIIQLTTDATNDMVAFKNLLFVLERYATMEDGIIASQIVGNRVLTSVLANQRYGDGSVDNGYVLTGTSFIDFDFDVPTAGLYKIDFLGSSSSGDVDTYVCGKKVLNSEFVTDAGFAEMENITAGNILLQKGVQRIRIQNVSGMFHMRKLILTSIRERLSTEPYSVTVFAKNSVEQSVGGLAIYNGSDLISDGIVIGTDGWVSYNVNVPAGNYKITVFQGNSTANSTLLLNVNSANVGEYKMDNTGTGISTGTFYEQSAGVVSLAQSANTIKLMYGAGSVAVGYFTIEKLTAPLVELYNGTSAVGGQQVTALTDGDMTVKAYLSDAVVGKPVIMLTAIYNGSTMHKIVASNIVTGTENTVFTATINDITLEQGVNHKIKTFFWDGLSIMEPIYAAVEN